MRTKMNALAPQRRPQPLDTPLSLPRTRTTARPCRQYLMSDEVREEVSEEAEKRQPGDAISGKNPSSAACEMPVTRRVRRCLLRNLRYRGPIFHARKPPNGRIVAQLHYASRLPGIMAGQDNLGGILLRFSAQRVKKESRNLPRFTKSTGKSMPGNRRVGIRNLWLRTPQALLLAYASLLSTPACCLNIRCVVHGFGANRPGAQRLFGSGEGQERREGCRSKDVRSRCR